MQKPKDEVRQAILDAALDEFYIYGFKRASIRNIAERAGITPGNVYCYFGGKAELFSAVLEQTMGELDQLVRMAVSRENSRIFSFEKMAKGVTELFIKNRKQFLILVNGSAGSRYENAKNELIRIASLRIQLEFIPLLPEKERDSLLPDMLAAAAVEGILTLLVRYDGDKERLFSLVNILIKQLFSTGN